MSGVATSLQIERVHAVEHSAPSAEGTRRPGWSWSFLLRLHTAGELALTGTGESHAREKISPAAQKRAWQDLAGAGRKLSGRCFATAEDPADVVSSVLAENSHPTVRITLMQAVGDLFAQAQGEDGAPAPVYEELLPHIRRHLWSPSPAPLRDPEGRKANSYDLSIFTGFPRVGEANQELQKVALSYGLRTRRTSWKDFSAWDETGSRIVFGLSFSEGSSPVSGVITENKQLTRHFLQTAGGAVPRGRTFCLDEVEAAVAYAAELGYPVVVKPVSGKSGQGVVAGIEGDAGVRWAAAKVTELQEGRGRFIVEDHILGQDYRIYVAYGKVLSVVMRRPASVVGDGIRSVAELVLAKNHQRMQNPHTRTRLIRIDETSSYQLQKLGMDWSSVPEPDQTVVLAGAANISRGGDSIEVLPETHPSILQAATHAVEAIPGLNQAGVDFLLSDHRVDLAEQPGGICEINTTPALMANQAPMFGEVQPVARELVRLAAEASGLRIREDQETIRLAVRAQGVADVEALQKWVTTHAQRLELSGRIRSAGSTYLRVLLGGPTERVSALVAAMHSGRFDERPDWVRTAPFRGKMPQSFREATA